ncbi:protein P21-like [Juglans microcarpa x Juglans regia]|uniref:protein P21-like n=1 Tax=Juglans microcarpa x Juglans regia TaxID=2249226 RepID=UPI001B7DF9A1|nr:protein P21-like [Juglans microcarpa x Juglans regia]
MNPSTNLSINLYYLCIINLCFALTHAATFVITNNCSYTVWAAAIPGGGMELDPRGGTWIIDVPSGTSGGRIWARTGCVHLDEATATRRKLKPAAYSISQETGPPHVGILASTMCSNGGLFQCQTGDCGGLLQCEAYGAPPNTLAEYALNQLNNLDFFDISLVDGFNVPLEFSPTSNGCTRGIRCTADINGQCPNELRAPGGCNNPCTVFKSNQYCCNSGSCAPTSYSRFFKERCPDAYSYPKDDQTSTFTCNGGTNYKVTFCP